ncbi:MAG: hypothetical protein ACRDJE_05505 [Dehalococcoidia bacterium]
MTDRLIHLWRWIGAHRLLAGWAVVLLAVTVFTSSVALGAAQETPARFQERVDAPPARVKSTSIQAVVTGRRGDAWIARTADGERLVIRTTEKTTYRLKNKRADASAITQGSRIIILGRPGARPGVIVARIISVRSQKGEGQRAREAAAPLDGTP